MPKREDIHKVLIIGSGPIVIGQAAEFDYSGTQACKALRQLGYEIVLVNSNPATIMTDPGMADRTYLEPLNAEMLEKIIEKERPDAVLPNLGGQNGLNLTSELYKKGVLEKYGVKILGVQADAIERGEDRIAFKETMNKLGIEVPRSEATLSVEGAEKIAQELGYPVVIRPAYTMGGTGGGLVYNVDELRTIASRGISASLVGQILIEESVLGWEELELEVVRDADNNKITVCFIENVDAMGVHTGDSFCTAPMLTIKKELQERLQEYSYRIVEAIGVIGGTNIQFAHDPVSDRVVAIEINPRTSRSSALASKATGFPIALVSAKLAGGLLLSDIPYWRDGTLDKYTPSGDYVVVKFARWAFEKFPGSIDKLGTQMRAVGEVMSIGKTYKEAFQKAIRSLETGRYGLGFAKNFNKLTLDKLRKLLIEPSSERQFIMYEALRKGMPVEELYQLTHIKHWFVQQMKELVELENEILKYRGKVLPDALLIRTKKDGFSDRYLGKILGVPEKQIRKHRLSLGLRQAWNIVPVSGAENVAYYYSTYNAPDEVPVSDRRKIMIIGGGPNRIGQGIEFDYCSVHSAWALQEAGYKAIMINSNPETVSTDFDTSDRLYFEALDEESVRDILENETSNGGTPPPSIVQFGGQTAINLAEPLSRNGMPLIGSSAETIDLAEDRRRFEGHLAGLGIPQPPGASVTSLEEGLKVAEIIGYPVLIRPSYVLGGRAMEICYNATEMVRYMSLAMELQTGKTVLIDKYMIGKEVEVDAVCDGREVLIPGIMEHIERAGVHSGDAMTVYPGINLTEPEQQTLVQYSTEIGLSLKIRGLMNIQYVITRYPGEGSKVYVIELNPRASRTIPFISKLTGVPMVNIATKVMLGKTLRELGYQGGLRPLKKLIGIKAPVFSMQKLAGVDTYLGPEMKSTGEVMGVDYSFYPALAKALIAAGLMLPDHGAILFSVADRDKAESLPIIRKMAAMGYTLYATEGTASMIKAVGLPVTTITKKMNEGHPNVVDIINDGTVKGVVNTLTGGQIPFRDGFHIRRAAVEKRIPCFTSLLRVRADSDEISTGNEIYTAQPLSDYRTKAPA